MQIFNPVELRLLPVIKRKRPVLLMAGAAQVFQDTPRAHWQSDLGVHQGPTGRLSLLNERSHVF